MRRQLKLATNPLRLRQRPPLRAVAFTSCALLLILVAAGAYQPRTALALPGLASLLRHAAPILPAGIAWMHDHGTPRLRAGAYLGWSDGTTGQLYLYGTGCATQPEGDQLTYLSLSGSGGRLQVPAHDVQHLISALDAARPHPHLGVRVVTDRTMNFDRATLRCRSGAETTVRIAATVFHAPRLLTADMPQAAALPVSSLGSFPGVGLTAELALATGDAPFTVRSLRYAPASVATDVVRAVAGRAGGVPAWRALARPGHGPPVITDPWSLDHQSKDDPRAYGPRLAHALDLTLNPHESGLIVVNAASFRATPTPRPLLLLPILDHGSGAAPGLLVAKLAFGWTPRP